MSHTSHTVDSAREGLNDLAKKKKMPQFSKGQKVRRITDRKKFIVAKQDTYGLYLDGQPNAFFNPFGFKAA
jgi:hypothetical protein